MGAKLSKIVIYQPEKVITNDDLAKEWEGWDPNRYFTKTGIISRNIVKENETSLDMAEKAFLKLDEENQNTIDFIIFCTETPDMFFPSNANILHGRLKLKTTVGALDINLGCSGYVYGLAIAKGLIEGGIASKIALVTSDTYSKLISPDDRASRALFGDAATVSIIESSIENQIEEFVLGSDGTKADSLFAKHQDKNKNSPTNYFYMDGSAVFNFMIEIVPYLINETLQKNNTTLAEIDKVILHQANSYILEHLRSKLDIDKKKFFNDMRFEGNTVSSTIPIALEKCITSKQLKNGDKVFLAGFGVGLSWAGTTVII